jgi:cyclic beta-1,2-glucan synthetase
LPRNINFNINKLKSIFSIAVGSTEVGQDDATEETPLRSGLFSIEQLREHAKTFASQHELWTRHGPDLLIPRLLDNERLLLETYDALAVAVKKEEQITPAAEWLLDNFYLIEEQILTARRHLPPAYSGSLPQLGSGPSKGAPRVYSIALELIAHVDGGVDMEGLESFTSSYQSVTPLKIGELWAVPIMLRLALIENLRRVAVRLTSNLRDRESASVWAEEMLRVVEESPSDLILVLADMSRAVPNFSVAFVAELTRHLHGQSPHFAFAQSWMEHRLVEQGVSTAQVVQLESHAQAIDQISIGNSITSLRFLSSTDWRDFVERQSVVEQTLLSEPAAVYGGMDFATRNSYRNVVESMARLGRMTESEVASQAVALAADALAAHANLRTTHVGYYLVGKGQAQLEQLAGVRAGAWGTARKLACHYPFALYIGAILAVTISVSLVLAAVATAYGAPWWAVALLSLPALSCVLHFAVGLVNWLCTLFVGACLIPRLDFRDGIPEAHRTMVVVPTMLGDADTVRDLLERIEIHYAANRDPHIHFALLTDFADAPEEHLPGDDAQVSQICEGVQQLNRKYAHERRDIFFLYHRPRRWNPGEGVWMGRERKRGKLEEFNALLRGECLDCFSEIIGDRSVPAKVKYVVTLDTDTQLPRDAVRQLAGAMAHPLNRPAFDATRRCIVEGYGILQPRVATMLPTASRSWFVRLFAADVGLDPYTRVVSDVYQDLFGEGSFIGKGIYDVDAFRQTCLVFPDNTILSHDLIEGIHARSGLLTDVELYEDFPSRYSVDAKRRHRWIRGDWQIARWLLPRVPAADGRLTTNQLSALSRWKIFDNLRRSLASTGMVMLVVMACLMPWPWLAAGAVLLVVSLLLALPMFSVATELCRRPVDLSWMLHLRAFGPALARRAGQFYLTIAFLPYDAYLSLDAVGRTLARILWSRRHMLEWTTSSDAARQTGSGWRSYCRTMVAAPVLSVVLLLLVGLAQPGNLPATFSLLSLWFASPLLAWYVSRTLAEAPANLSEEQTLFLRLLARKTWRYFEVFSSEAENWLPPDNFQERPSPVLATRTSPTNIAVGLLSNLSACDFGYESVASLIRRCGDTLTSMARLERHRGHFYNWYDTRTLDPLQPLYVSTVDSGNLALHLLVLERGLLAQMDARIVPERMFDGIHDTLRVYAGIAPAPMQDALATLLQDPPAGLIEIRGRMDEAMQMADSMTSHDEQEPEADWWGNALRQGIRGHLEDLEQLAPWCALSAPPSELWSIPAAASPELQREMHLMLEQLDRVATLRQVADYEQTLLPALERVCESLDGSTAAGRWVVQLTSAVQSGVAYATNRTRELERLAAVCAAFAIMDFTFLYDDSRNLMSIGYNVSDGRLDAGVYDLLATEARMASYLAIAQGQVGQEHWFALRRMLTTSTGLPALLSWNGSMFEYLMPLLLMPTFKNTLLDKTYRAVVQRQVDYGKSLGIPWGISESGYNLRDVHHTYQYRGFGVPGLGLKRGLVEDRVVAPYASMLALMVAPKAACENLQRLAAEGRAGAYGLYEAIDYTPSRLPRGSEGVTVWSFMVHHQGMSLLALAYLLLDQPMQRRFNADPALRATELLLHERIPRSAAPIYPHAIETHGAHAAATEMEEPMRILTDPSAGGVEVHLLSNGRYHVMVSNSGGGYSRWRDLAVTRWREDPTRDCWGSFCYLRDVDTGRFWSVGYQPTLKRSDPYEAVFVQAKAEFRRRDEQIELHTEISVSPEDDMELRRTTITNRSEFPRTIEITSYAEVVLAPVGQDLTHPAFSNLFVQTELLRPLDAILCTRRPRSAEEHPPWMTHLMRVTGEVEGSISFETSRLNFIGRGRTLARPEALASMAPLSDTEGCVLDPIVSIRRTIRLEAGESARVDIVTGVADTRDAAVALTEKYQDPRLSDRVYELAWTHSQVELRHINASESDAQLYLRLAGAVIYASSRHRAHPEILMRNRRSQAGLWGHGISGDLPIMLVRIRHAENLELVSQAFQAHAYWRMKGLVVDLVIWNEDESIYRQDLFDTILDLIAASPEAGFVDKPGGVYLRRGEQIPEEDRILLQASARVVLADEDGSFREQLEPRRRVEAAIPPLKPMHRQADTPPQKDVRRDDLKFFNGIGGFTKDGREYITVLRPGDNTPAPWCNVIANPNFGTLVSESGSVYTWADNCHEYRLTPWGNDPISDVSGEAVYLRDEESGQVWSPTPQPARGENTYITRHGFGYSVYEYHEDGITTELTIYVSVDAPVKFARLKITNHSGRARRLSATAYWELVLGELRSKSLMHVVTELEKSTGAVLARNAYNTEYDGRVAFFGTSEPRHLVTGDRSEFLGRNGSTAAPAALRRARLSGRLGAGFDPCVAIQVPFQLEANEQKDVVFIAGSAHSEREAREVLQKSLGVPRAQAALEAVWRQWGHLLGAVHVETPDAALNFMVNGWLPYQTISCRMWGRTGFYQSGGAFGFRDQLQDSMSLIHAAPELVREHVLRAASRQFVEGDVQHWWHAQSGRGVRTHFSDDYLWLPYAVCRYVRATGDTGVLSAGVGFLDGRTVHPDEEGYYDLPQTSNEQATLYEHCVRAVRHGLRFGDHGLPLMGCGDWNDGMNLVGQKGKGESVWLAFFLHDVLTQFAALAQLHGDTSFAAQCLAEATALAQRIEENGWDGQWYRRAYFDDGQPLGSSENMECQIDSIAQSWAVLTAAGDPARARQAMESVDARLVRRDAQLIQLFDPPFDKSDQNPGYIKGYTPGVRENGGQYTHAAIWTAMAFAELKDAKRAWEISAMLNPVSHAQTPEAMRRYRVEPYVVAADVYGAPPHVGRGGWTWYTGSSAWMYRLITESLLGLHLEVDHLRFTPCLPGDWLSFTLHYRHRETTYHITIHNGQPGSEVKRILLDGQLLPGTTLPLTDDHMSHTAEVFQL